MNLFGRDFLRLEGRARTKQNLRLPRAAKKLLASFFVQPGLGQKNFGRKRRARIPFAQGLQKRFGLRVLCPRAWSAYRGARFLPP